MHILYSSPHLKHRCDLTAVTPDTTGPYRADGWTRQRKSLRVKLDTAIEWKMMLGETGLFQRALKEA